MKKLLASPLAEKKLAADFAEATGHPPIVFGPGVPLLGEVSFHSAKMALLVSSPTRFTDFCFSKI